MKEKGFTQHHFSRKRFKQIKITKSGAGFTLIEVLVVSLLLSLVIGTVLGVFISVIWQQRYNLSQQRLLDQTGYAVEYMSRFIRMAKINPGDGGACGSELPSDPDKNFKVGSGNDSLIFINYHNECHIFSRDTSLGAPRLKESRDGNDYYLTSGDIEIVSLQFLIRGDGLEDAFEPDEPKQPKVTMFLEVKGVGGRYQPKLSVQTSVSMRNPDIPPPNGGVAGERSPFPIYEPY